jgi:hypothetical protein
MNRKFSGRLGVAAETNRTFLLSSSEILEMSSFLTTTNKPLVDLAALKT